MDKEPAMRLFILIPLTFSLLLAGCGNMKPFYPLNSSASSPAHEGTIVIVALLGEGDIMQFHSGYFNEFKVPKRKGRKVNILAYELKPDMKSFGITNIDYYAEKLNENEYRRKYLKKEWHKIDTSRPGIYHYGTIISSDEKLTVTDNIDKSLLPLAKQRYSGLYQSLQVIR
jgi:hypothetical protein